MKEFILIKYNQKNLIRRRKQSTSAPKRQILSKEEEFAHSDVAEAGEAERGDRVHASPSGSGQTLGLEIVTLCKRFG
jgi:hypothetical protein